MAGSFFMSHHHSHISSAKHIIGSYTGDAPFALFIRKFFAVNKKYGSRDRKQIAALCYHYYRTGKAFADRSIEEKILFSLFLCEHEPVDILGSFYPGLNASITLSTGEKIRQVDIDVTHIFPGSKYLSGYIDAAAFCRSFLEQPLLFLRIRPGKHAGVKEKLSAAQIAYTEIGPDARSVPQSTKIDSLLAINRDVVIQDLNSQQVFQFLDALPAAITLPENISVWDCCAASGGKSILIYDKLKKKIKLTVSDIRKNILHNCTARLQQAKVPVYKTLLTDLTQHPAGGFTDRFDLIICDAPCTGSGTWGRNPEQLQFFNDNTISTYVDKQKKIGLNAWQRLQPGGLMFYITCSVFEKENESVAAHLQRETGGILVHQQYYKGYQQKADTMFVAALYRP